MSHATANGQRNRTTIYSATLASCVMLAGSAHAAFQISTDPTHDVSCSDGTCTATAKNAILNTTDLAGMLENSDVKLASGAGAVTIGFISPFSWVSAHRLTVDADANVAFRAPVTIAGPGGLTIITNNAGAGGDLFFYDGGYADFWDLSSSLIINGTSFVLVDTLTALKDAANNNPSGNYALTKSYDAFKNKIFHATLIPTFSGTLEGLGHDISNLSINASQNARKKGRARVTLLAMFGSSTGTLRDIGLLNTSISGGDYHTAALVGENDGTIISARTSGTVTGTYYAGGLTSLNRGTVAWSHSDSAVSAEYAGGAVGYNIGTISESYATGPITTHSNYTSKLGGLVGINDKPTGVVSQSYATSTVSNGSEMGGLIGENNGVVTLSHSEGQVSTFSNQEAGGLIGANTGTVSQSFATGASSMAGLVGGNAGTITQCYATGAVTGYGYVGGLVGTTPYNGIITQSYSTGSVQDNSNTGGSIGYDGGSKISSVYWDTDTSGITNLSRGAGNIPYDPGIEGLTSDELKGKLPRGFDKTVWAKKASINGGFPYLRANPPPQ